MAVATLYGRTVDTENFQAATLPPRGFADLIGLDKFITGWDGPSLVLDNVPVFRSGTFKDMYGDQFTIGEFEIDAMVENFNYLARTGYLTAVPFRDGHKFELLLPNPASNGRVVGHFVGLGAETLICPTDGQLRRYLMGRILVTDPQAQIDIMNKTIRNVSAEIGPYETNEDLTYGPVFLGAAGVDLPAVEGLLFSHHAGGSLMSQPFIPVQQGQIGQAGQVNGFAGLVQRAAPAAQGLATAQAPPVQPIQQVQVPQVQVPQVQPIQQLPPAQQFQQALAQYTQPVAQQPAPPAQSVQLPQAQQVPTLQQQAPQRPAAHSFACAGQAVTDPSQVQSYIQYLEQRTSLYSRAFRSMAVVNLSLGNHIPATDVDSTTAFVNTLSDEQFESWFAMAGRQSVALFAGHAAGQAPAQQANPGAGIPQQPTQQAPNFGFGQQAQPVVQSAACGVPPQAQAYPAGPQQVFGAPQQSSEDLALARTVVNNLITAGEPSKNIREGQAYAKLVAAGCAPPLA